RFVSPVEGFDAVWSCNATGNIDKECGEIHPDLLVVFDIDCRIQRRKVSFVCFNTQFAGDFYLLKLRRQQHIFIKNEISIHRFAEIFGKIHRQAVGSTVSFYRFFGFARPKKKGCKKDEYWYFHLIVSVIRLVGRDFTILTPNHTKCFVWFLVKEKFFSKKIKP